jgi:hypothetical protein
VDNLKLQQLALLAGTPVLTYWIAYGYAFLRERYLEWSRENPNPQRPKLRYPRPLESWPALFLESAVISLVAALSVVGVAATRGSPDVRQSVRGTAFWGLVSIPPLILAAVVWLTQREQSIVRDVTVRLSDEANKDLRNHQLLCIIVSYIVACFSILYGNYAVMVVMASGS